MEIHTVATFCYIMQALVFYRFWYYLILLERRRKESAPIKHLLKTKFQSVLLTIAMLVLVFYRADITEFLYFKLQ